MTRGEAIKALERADGYVEIHYINGVEEAYINPHLREAVKVALSALRPITREQVEKVWRGEWIGDNDEKVGTIEGSPIKSSTCSACGNWLVGSDEYDCAGYFCPSCGAAQTDEAVEMVMERLEALKDGSTPD